MCIGNVVGRKEIIICNIGIKLRYFNNNVVWIRRNATQPNQTQSRYYQFELKLLYRVPKLAYCELWNKIYIN